MERLGKKDYRKRFEHRIYANNIWLWPTKGKPFALPIDNVAYRNPEVEELEKIKEIAYRLPADFPEEKIMPGGIAFGGDDILKAFPELRRDIFLYSQSENEELSVMLDVSQAKNVTSHKIILPDFPDNEKNEDFRKLQDFLSVKATTRHGSGPLLQTLDVNVGLHFINKTLNELYDLSREVAEEVVEKKESISVSEKKVWIYYKIYLMFQVVKRILDVVAVCKVAYSLEKKEIKVNGKQQKNILEIDSFRDLFEDPDVGALNWFSKYKVFLLLTNELCNHFKHDQDAAAAMNYLSPDYCRIFARRRTKNGSSPLLHHLEKENGYSHLLEQMTKELGPLGENSYVKFDMYLSHYALVFREFLLDTIFSVGGRLSNFCYLLSFDRTFYKESGLHVLKERRIFRLGNGNKVDVIVQEGEVF